MWGAVCAPTPPVEAEQSPGRPPLVAHSASLTAVLVDTPLQREPPSAHRADHQREEGGQAHPTPALWLAPSPCLPGLRDLFLLPDVSTRSRHALQGPQGRASRSFWSPICFGGRDIIHPVFESFCFCFFLIIVSFFCRAPCRTSDPQTLPWEDSPAFLLGSPVRKD